MKVQWLYYYDNGKKTNVKVMKVLELDGEIISSLLSEAQCLECINKNIKYKNAELKNSKSFESTHLAKGEHYE